MAAALRAEEEEEESNRAEMGGGKEGGEECVRSLLAQFVGKAAAAAAAARLPSLLLSFGEAKEDLSDSLIPTRAARIALGASEYRTDRQTEGKLRCAADDDDDDALPKELRI